MKHHDDRFTGSGSRSIYFQCWQPDSGARALLLVAHGAGEHSGRYQSLAEYFCGHGYALAALDHHGHGYSEGCYGHVGLFGDYLDDLAEFHRRMLEEVPGVPVFLVGHSMGGLISASYLLGEHPELAGCVLSGPAIMTAPEPGAVQMAIIRLLALVLPWIGLLKLDVDGVSRDPDVVARYEQDPLVNHGRMSARMLRELFAGMALVQSSAAAITQPMLIMHGEGDVMTAPSGSRFLHDAISSPDKTLKIYPGLYHEIFNEPERLEVLADVLQWCEQRTPAG